MPPSPPPPVSSSSTTAASATASANSTSERPPSSERGAAGRGDAVDVPAAPSEEVAGGRASAAVRVKREEGWEPELEQQQQQQQRQHQRVDALGTSGVSSTESTTSPHAPSHDGDGRSRPEDNLTAADGLPSRIDADARAANGERIVDGGAHEASPSVVDANFHAAVGPGHVPPGSVDVEADDGTAGVAADAAKAALLSERASSSSSCPHMVLDPSTGQVTLRGPTVRGGGGGAGGSTAAGKRGAHGAGAGDATPTHGDEDDVGTRRVSMHELLRRYTAGLRYGAQCHARKLAALAGEETGEAGQNSNGHTYAWAAAAAAAPPRRSRKLPLPTCSECGAGGSRMFMCLECAAPCCFYRPTAAAASAAVDDEAGEDDVGVSMAGALTSSCAQRHLTRSGHSFAFDITSGTLYCGGCADIVHRSEFARALEREARRAPFRKGIPPRHHRRAKLEAAAAEGTPPICRVPKGLRNLGATCFLNVILQSFIHNPLLRNYFLSDRHNTAMCPVRERCLACELDKLFQEFYASPNEGAAPPPAFAPATFLFCVYITREGTELSHAGEQDAHELFIQAVNGMHSALCATGREPCLRNAQLPSFAFGDAAWGLGASLLDASDRDVLDETARRSHSPWAANADVMCACVVHRTFAGVLQSDVTCQRCQLRSSTHDPILDLSLDIRPSRRRGGRGAASGAATVDVEAAASGGAATAASSYLESAGGGGGATLDGAGAWRRGGKRARKLAAGATAGGGANSAVTAYGAADAGPGGHGGAGSGGSDVLSGSRGDDEQSLVACLRRYCSRETLSSEGYSCAGCGPGSQAFKQLSLARLPPVLCIQLKRFEHSSTSSSKIETRVRFPLTLDVREFCTSAIRDEWPSRLVPDADAYHYHLFCVAVHEGRLESGHYYCYVRWRERWYLANDHAVREAADAEVLACRPYQLFYRRRVLFNVR